MSSDLAVDWLDHLAQQPPFEQPDWLNDVQSGARSAFSQYGLPGRKEEHWKYTPIRSLQGRRLSIASDATVTSEITPPLLAGTADICVTMRDGALDNIDGNLPEGLTILTMSEGLDQYESRLRPKIESLDIQGTNRSFAALNTASLKHGLLLHVAEGTRAGVISLHWASNDLKAADFFQSRVVILMDSGAQMMLVEQFGHSPELAGNEAMAGLNLITQTELAADANLNHVRIQIESEDASLITDTRVHQHDNSTYTYTGLDLGGGLVRHDISSELAGVSARTDISGAFVLDGKRHVDNHILADHIAQDCSSEQYFRGVLGGNSRGVFNGKALIRQGADGSSVRQSNANLLLSAHAEMDTKPELEIYADEVEASHGATVGQLDEAAVFYLQTRGLDKQQARHLLTTAFCNSVVTRFEANDSGIANTTQAVSAIGEVMNQELVRAMQLAAEVIE